VGDFPWCLVSRSLFVSECALIDDSDNGEGRRVDDLPTGFVVDVIMGVDDSFEGFGDATLSAVDESARLTSRPGDIFVA